MDRRMLCLDRRLFELRAATQLLIDAGPKELDRGIDLLASLTSVRVCEVSESLLRGVVLTEHPERREQIRAASRMADEAKILLRAGKLKQSRALAERAVRDAETLGNHALIAETKLRLGNVQVDTDGFTSAAKTTREAFYAALESGYDNVAGWAALRMLYLTAHVGVTETSADNWAGIARAYRHRVTPATAFQSRLEQYLGILASRRGRNDEAIAHMERAAAILEKDPEAHPLDVSDMWTHTSLEYSQAGRPALALARNKKALDLARSFAGPANMIVGKYLMNDIDPLLALGRPKEALAAADKSLAILEPLLGAKHAFLAEPLVGGARALLALGNPALGLARAQRALVLYRNAPGPDGSWRAQCLVVAAEAAAQLGQHALAFDSAVEAVRLAETVPASSSTWADRVVLEASAAAAEANRDAEVRSWLERLAKRTRDTPRWQRLLKHAAAVRRALEQRRPGALTRLARLLATWK